MRAQNMIPGPRTWRLLAGIGREIGPAVCALHVTVGATAFLAPLLGALGLRPLVDGAVGGDAGRVAAGAALTGLALLLSVSAPVGYRWATVRLRERSRMVVQRRLLTLSASAPHLEHLERPAFRDRLELLKGGVEDLANGLTLAATAPLLASQLIAVSALLGQVQPVLLLVPVVALPAVWLSRRAQSHQRAAELRAAADRRTAEQLFSLATSAASGAELRVYGLGEELLARHRRSSGRAQRAVESGLLRSAAATAGAWLLFALAYVGALAVVLGQVTAGRATAGDVAMTLGLAAAVVGAAAALADLAGSAARVGTAAGHYHWLHDRATARRPGGARPPARLADGIRLQDVSFGYGEGRAALSGVSLHLPAGAVVALVGENGAGKTTLVKLLCGMYAPGGGRIDVDGTDLADLDLEAWRRRVTAGFQDFARLETSVREGVGVGDLPLREDDAAVRAALDAAGADFVERLPRGLDTQLGTSWEGGVELSGGQWQKLALARAFLRPSPLLAVLDEPAAALDPPTEHALFEQVAADARRGRAEGRVTVLVSHRFSTVRMADLIVVLNGGRIREQGTHDELMALDGGLYAELYGLQARAYR